MSVLSRFSPRFVRDAVKSSSGLIMFEAAVGRVALASGPQLISDVQSAEFVWNHKSSRWVCSTSLEFTISEHTYVNNVAVYVNLPHSDGPNVVFAGCEERYLASLGSGQYVNAGDTVSISPLCLTLDVREKRRR